MLDGDFLALALLTSGLSILCSAGPSGHCGVLGSIRGPTHSMAAAPSLPVPMIQDFSRVQRALGASPFPGEKPWVEQRPSLLPLQQSQSLPLAELSARGSQVCFCSGGKPFCSSA